MNSTQPFHTLQLGSHELNLILEGLGNLPYNKSAKLIQGINNQLTAAYKKQQDAIQEAKSTEDTPNNKDTKGKVSK